MIELASKTLCSGCAACRAVCSQKAITMVADGEGFLYPRINPSLCISCGKCRGACPVLHPGKKRTPLAVYAAIAKDTALRLASSSGGVFSLLARQILAKGGIVFGAAWDYQTHGVKIAVARNEDELDALRGSKYVQADVGNAYLEVKDELEKGTNVLYSGTPCQIAALKHVLNCDYANLLTVEVICHAVPSPLAFVQYATQREHIAGHTTSRIFSRNKHCSWKRYARLVSFHDTNIAYLASLDQDAFLRGFLAELYNRPSCHACSVRDLRSGADLTIADYWNVHQKFPDMDDDKGTSLVLVHTPQGVSAFEGIQGLCRVRESDYADARRTNPAIYSSPRPHPRRAKFFKWIQKSDDFDRIVSRLLRPTLMARIRHLGGRILRKLGLRR